jgi:hypothetical protein
MVRLMRARPRSTSSASFMWSPVASLRRPEEAALFTGTRRVMRFSSKVTMITFRDMPATGMSSMPCTWPTPWVG